MAPPAAMAAMTDATTTKIKRVDEQRKILLANRRKITSVAHPRKPGKGIEVEEEDEDKLRFVEPLAQLMSDCKVGHLENISASDNDIMNSHRRKVQILVSGSEIPTLHKALTTAAELRQYLRDRPMHMEVDNIEPIALEEFIWKSQAKNRAVNAIGWMCRNLHLGWAGMQASPNCTARHAQGLVRPY